MYGVARLTTLGLRLVLANDGRHSTATEGRVNEENALFELLKFIVVCAVALDADEHPAARLGSIEPLAEAESPRTRPARACGTFAA